MHSSKHTDMRQVRDSSRAQGQIQTHIKSATPVIALALDLSADKDTIFWLHYDCGQDEFYTSSQQPQFKPEDLNFRLMQWRAVTQKLLSLSPCPFCMHRAEFAAANQLFVSVWTPIPVPGTNSDRIGPVLCMQKGADLDMELNTDLIPCSMPFQPYMAPLLRLFPDVLASSSILPVLLKVVIS